MSDKLTPDEMLAMGLGEPEPIVVDISTFDDCGNQRFAAVGTLEELKAEMLREVREGEPT